MGKFKNTKGGKPLTVGYFENLGFCFQMERNGEVIMGMELPEGGALVLSHGTHDDMVAFFLLHKDHGRGDAPIPLVHPVVVFNRDEFMFVYKRSLVLMLLLDPDEHGSIYDEKFMRWDLIPKPTGPYDWKARGDMEREVFAQIESGIYSELMGTDNGLED